jgi:hypothetical protein
VDGLRTAFEKTPKAGLLLLGQMSTKGNLISEAYTEATVSMAEANPDFVFGFISQKRLRSSAGPDPFVYMTPGVKMEQGGDALGQQYVPPPLCSHMLHALPSFLISLCQPPPVLLRAAASLDHSKSVTTSHLRPDSSRSQWTPNLSYGGRYRTPHSVIVGDGCDVIIVGRGIYGAADPATAAQAYAKAGWDAYTERLK